MTTIDLPDENATAALAARLAAVVRPGDIIALKGELGAGKTSFARAFIRARGGDETVPSPSFTLVQTYDLPGGTVWHFDLYRLRAAEEAWELGVEEAFHDGIALIEWPGGSGLHCRPAPAVAGFTATPGAAAPALSGRGRTARNHRGEAGCE